VTASTVHGCFIFFEEILQCEKGDIPLENIKVGTCSWTDRTLLASGWYPKTSRNAAGMLGYYASRFNTVEVDSTFYAIPDEGMIYNWIARSPSDFKFNIKAYGIFTFHSVWFSSLPPWLKKEIKGGDNNRRIRFSDIPRSLRLELWHRFERVISPLHKTGKMGYMLFQLPPWAVFSDRMIRYMGRVAEIACDFRIALEVRNSTWLAGDNRKAFLDLLRNFNIAYVVVDEPDLDWTVRPEVHLTSTWGSVIRFHGRNTDAWSRKDTSVQERFRYLYNESELIPWKNSILDIASDVGTVYAMFNNCYRNYAVKNAEGLKRLMGMDTPGETGVQGDLGLV